MSSLDRLAHEIRAINPRRLARWNGWSVAGETINPYFDYSRSLMERAPREFQFADLLIGDVFADTLLHPELKVSTKDGCIYWPHRGRPDG